eukprot:TRINITY_DN1420_c1_g1_i2.p5 TRINITY_DN1420_c1_g1~~TRINITY_DN1420_c1_g1_i2.p5  ORF type:complete len:213 (+),score=-13.59 TRINITY_DN1420_c1_g1_i2:1615-2253(+)
MQNVKSKCNLSACIQMYIYMCKYIYLYTYIILKKVLVYAYKERSMEMFCGGLWPGGNKTKKIATVTAKKNASQEFNFSCHNHTATKYSNNIYFQTSKELVSLPKFSCLVLCFFIWQRYDKNVYLTQDTHVEDVKYVGFESSWQNFTKKYFHREKQIFAKVIVYLYNDCNSQFQWFVNQSGLLKNCHQRYFNVLIQSYCTIRLLHKRIVTKTK